MKDMSQDFETAGRKTSSGFTLIEVSIVLVIIGLIIGGVLVGKDLIGAAEIRGQISQVEKYSTAIQTFRVKYGGLPGDLLTAASFGFPARGSYTGQGDGNGVVQGIYGTNPNNSCNGCLAGGEVTVFWVDLSMANLIPESFNTATATSLPVITGTAIDLYYPHAYLGDGNYLVYSGGQFFITGLTDIGVVSPSYPQATTNLSVLQAYNIDQKIDDGLPQAGRIQAKHYNTVGGTLYSYWASTSNIATPYTTATPSGNNCFNNGNVNGATQLYSIGVNGGNGKYCAIAWNVRL